MDLAGQRFAHLEVIRYAGRRGVHKFWLCRCDCGAEVYHCTNKLRSGRQKSCGCKRKEMISRFHRRHGASRSPEYYCWCNLRRRCFDTTIKNFDRYGGRGITVCTRWITGEGGIPGFECFLADVGPRPSPKHSIDRVNNDGNYEPGNCRWATKAEQLANRAPPRPYKWVKRKTKAQQVGPAC